MSDAHLALIENFERRSSLRSFLKVARAQLSAHENASGALSAAHLSAAHPYSAFGIV